MTIQNLWNAAKSVLRRKFIAIKSYLKKEKKISNNLILHLNQRKSNKQTPKLVEGKKSSKIRAEIKETKKTIAEVNETKSLSFLRRLTKLLILTQQRKRRG